jgi:hypothetical protein
VPTVDGGHQQVDVPMDETVYRTEAPAAAPAAEEEVAEERSARRSWILVVVGSVLVVGIGVLVWWLARDAGRGDPEVDPGTATENVQPVDPVGGYVPPVRDLEVKADGDEVVVTWEPPRESEEGDRYGYRVLSLTSQSQLTPTDETTARVPRNEGQETCVEVFVVRGAKQSAQGEQQCAPAGGGKGD